MAAQAALIADTLAGMRRTLSDNQYSSDSDNPYNYPTSRGSKLKRKVHYLHEGSLDKPNGPKSYKRKIEHAGYERHIISRNPRRYDSDGDELDDDDVDEQADADAAARNPYHEIRLEELLAPLTAAANLPTHPSLSHPYLSTTLSDMVQQACDMLHRERKTLWSFKGLLTKLRGDETWIPCGDLNSDVDDTIFNTESAYNEIINTRPRTNSTVAVKRRLANGICSPPTSTVKKAISLPSAPTAKASSTGNAVSSDLSHYATAKKNIKSDPTGSSGLSPNDPRPKKSERPGKKVNSTVPVNENDRTAEEVPIRMVDVFSEGNEDLSVDTNHQLRLGPGATFSSNPMDNVHTKLTRLDGPLPNQDNPKSPAGDKVLMVLLGGIENVRSDQNIVPAIEERKDEVVICGGDTEDVSQPAPHRMTTRAQAQAASEKSTSSRTRSASPVSWVPPFIHPLYLMSSSAHPDRNFGLPPNEAEEIRRTVIMYVQKQEEICRGAEKLYFGLLRADRMRKTVFKWCKSEGHIGEMSDGEDWYDKEEWGLEEDLRKGHDEEEEEAQGKKTRARRT